MFGENTIALVTGAATGIGYSTALAFARAGCHLVLADRDTDRGQAAAEAVEALGRRALSVKTEISDADQVVHLHQTALSAFGRLDVACNNAGIEGELAPTAESTLENFDRVIGVNLRGVFICLQQQLKIMSPQQCGAIVNVASITGLVGFAGLPSYCASKGGVGV